MLHFLKQIANCEKTKTMCACIRARRNTLNSRWPVSNRDLVVHLKVSQDIKTNILTVSAISVPDVAPKKENVVRIPASFSSWTVTPANESQFAVEYSMEIDPGGYVAPWMVNMVAA